MSHPHPELGTPPPLSEGALRITPLGGLGEIGRNMTVFEFGGKLLIVDCGVLFPEPEQPGVDLILPDFTPIRDRYDDVVAVVLTHGHEDHIGAVPYLLKERADIPLIGSQLTLALIEAKLGRAPDPAVHAEGEGGPDRADRPLRLLVPRGQPLHPGRPRRGRSRPRPASCCTPATSRWTSCRSTAG